MKFNYIVVLFCPPQICWKRRNEKHPDARTGASSLVYSLRQLEPAQKRNKRVN